MMTVECWTTIRYLHAQGKSIRAIAEELSIARNTVRAALRLEHPPHYQRTKRPNPKLEPFADQIKDMLFRQNFIGSRILRELRKLGYLWTRSRSNSSLRTRRASISAGWTTARNTSVTAWSTWSIIRLWHIGSP